MTPAIEVEGLRKSYGGVEAVRGVDLCVEAGQIFALLGPNGAGKTTTIEVLEGYRRRGAGRVSVLGFDPWRGGRRFRRRIGIVLQQSNADPYLKVTEALEESSGRATTPRPDRSVRSSISWASPPSAMPG